MQNGQQPKTRYSPAFRWAATSFVRSGWSAGFTNRTSRNSLHLDPVVQAWDICNAFHVPPAKWLGLPGRQRRLIKMRCPATWALLSRMPYL